MGQQLQPWRTAEASRRWLSTLIDAMEQASRPEIRRTPCDPQVLEQFRAQLSRPASLGLYRASPLAYRN